MASVFEDLHLMVVVVLFEVVEGGLDVPHWGDHIELANYDKPLH